MTCQTAPQARVCATRPRSLAQTSAINRFRFVRHRLRSDTRQALRARRKNKTDNRCITSRLGPRPAARHKMPITTLPVVKTHYHKKRPVTNVTGLLLGVWQCPTLTRGGPALPSALSGFTSEFGMESGGTHLLWPPDKLVNNQHCNRTL